MSVPADGMESCPVCESGSGLFLKQKRNYHLCPLCGHVFTRQQMTWERQKAHYVGQWANVTPELEKSGEVILEWGRRVTDLKTALDFGAGCGWLARLLRSKGLEVAEYEPMQHGDFNPRQYGKPFDAVFIFEVIEHIQNPLPVLRQIGQCLRPGGLLMGTTVIMDFAKVKDPLYAFSRFWYKDDMSHVNFYTKTSMPHLAGIMGWTVRILTDNHFILQKPE